MLELSVWTVRLVTAAVFLAGVGFGWFMRARWRSAPKATPLPTHPRRDLH